MSGAGSATHAITITSSVSGSSVTRTLTLNLSAATNGSVYVINMENGSIKKDGTETRSLYVSGEFWDIPAFAGQSWSVTSTGVSTKSLAWNPAFSV